MQEAQTLELAVDPDLFARNISAIRFHNPNTADAIEAAAFPLDCELQHGRDGTTTYAWSRAHGSTQWLGRTTMPMIRAKALVEAFDPGQGNTLLVSAGSGYEIALLLRRLAPYQAIMVVEESATEIQLLLRLHDFSAALKSQRLIFFVSDEAWNQFREFLIQHDGFLAPDRILAWPWIDGRGNAELSERLAVIQSDVAARRASEPCRRSAVAEPSGSGNLSYTQMQDASSKAEKTSPDSLAVRSAETIAIISNVSHPRVLSFATRMLEGVKCLEWCGAKFVLDNPALVHPAATHRKIAAIEPTLLILLDVAPAALPYPLPPQPIFVLITHTETLSDTWLRELPAIARLGVLTTAQLAQARNAGLETRTMLVRPAGRAQFAPSPQKPRGQSVLVLADGGDTSATAAGLHLASHVKLWNAARDILADKVDEYLDHNTPDILRAAERRCDITLENDEIRAAFIDQIRRRLGPLVVRKAYCEALLKAEIDFDIYGAPWPADSKLTAHHRGPSLPGPDQLPDYCCVLTVEPTAYPVDGLLDTLAAGLFALLRTCPDQGAPEGLRTMLNGKTGADFFDSRKKMLATIRDVQNHIAEHAGLARDAASWIAAKHTWSERISEFVSLINPWNQ